MTTSVPKIPKNILIRPPVGVTLNEGQMKAWTKMCSGENLFITGSGGTGKSLLVHLFVERMKGYNQQKGKELAVTSNSGTSAVHIKGKTVHSFFQLGVRRWTLEDYVDMVNDSPWIKTKWFKLRTLIIDEISMMHCWMFDLLESAAREIRGSDEVFGGIQVILTGDFLQLPCVKSAKFCFESSSWSKIVPYSKVVILTEIARQDDPIFRQVLNKIRFGVVDDQVKTILTERISVDISKDGIKPTRIYTRNNDVDNINKVELDKLLKDGRESFNYDMDIEQLKPRQQHKIQNFRDHCNIPIGLKLTMDAQVMLLANLDVTNGLANGSRGVVIGFNDDDLPIVRFLNGTERVIEWHCWEIEDNNIPIFKAYQIPLRVAYAITTHKSQSCTLDSIETDLSNLFEFGQAYVALSRVRTLEGLSIAPNIKWEDIKASPKAIEYYNSVNEYNQFDAKVISPLSTCTIISGDDELV